MQPLLTQPLRYKDLRLLIPNLSDKMLTERLADLSARARDEEEAARINQTTDLCADVFGEDAERASQVSNPLARLERKS